MLRVLQFRVTILCCLFDMCDTVLNPTVYSHIATTTILICRNTVRTSKRCTIARSSKWFHKVMVKWRLMFPAHYTSLLNTCVRYCHQHNNNVSFTIISQQKHRTKLGISFLHDIWVFFLPFCTRIPVTYYYNDTTDRLQLMPNTWYS